MWGGDSTCVSATSGLGDTTVVAAQAPISEANVTTSHEQIEVDGADPLLSTVSTTRLPATCTQAPVGSIQASISSSSRGSEPMYLSSLHPMGEARIPTHITLLTYLLPCPAACVPVTMTEFTTLRNCWHGLQQSAVDTSAIDGERFFAPANGPKEDILSSYNMPIECAIIDAVKHCSKFVECVFQIG